MSENQVVWVGEVDEDLTAAVVEKGREARPISWPAGVPSPELGDRVDFDFMGRVQGFVRRSGIIVQF